VTHAAVPLRYDPGRIARLVVDRPDRKNALDARSWELLDQALAAFERDDAARVLVLTGSGGDFCSGADIEGGINGPAEAVGPRLREIGDLLRRLHELPKPTLARVDGAAVGVGMSLALACDVVVASDRARFGAVFSRAGLVPDGGLSWLRPRLVGPHKAKELTLSGRLVPAGEARAIGLIGSVVPVGDLDRVTQEWAEVLAACPPAVAAGTLRLLDDAWSTTFAEALEREADAQQLAVAALLGRAGEGRSAHGHRGAS
jgi:enoyl-CoA hydratase/carnithine racemase